MRIAISTSWVRLSVQVGKPVKKSLLAPGTLQQASAVQTLSREERMYKWFAAIASALTIAGFLLWKVQALMGAATGK